MEGTIYLLDKCNFNCKHCYANKGTAELTFKQIEQINEYVEPMNIRKFSLLGGEPLLYPYLKETIELLPHVSVYTNGSFVEKNIDILKKAESVVVSIDGYKESSEAIRGPGTWKIAMDALDLLQTEKIKTMLRCSYHAGNLADVKTLVDMIAKPADVPIMFLPRIDLPPLSIKEQVNLYTYLMTVKDSKCFVQNPNFYQFIGEKGRCPAGDYRINFCSDGKITPCNMNFNDTIGNIGILPQALKWNIENYLQNIKLTPMECSACPRSDVCKGGCLVAKTYQNCPLKQNIDLKMVGENSGLDMSGVQQRFNDIKNIIQNVVTC